MKKVMSLMVVALMVMAIFLVGCTTEEVSDADLEEQFDEMSEEELQAVVDSTDESGTLAGQAVRFNDRTKLAASKALIKKIKADMNKVSSLENIKFSKLVLGKDQYNILDNGAVEITKEGFDAITGGYAGEEQNTCMCFQVCDENGCGSCDCTPGGCGSC